MWVLVEDVVGAAIRSPDDRVIDTTPQIVYPFPLALVSCDPTTPMRDEQASSVGFACAHTTRGSIPPPATKYLEEPCT